MAGKAARGFAAADFRKYGVNLKGKLLLSYFILIMMPFGLFTWLSYRTIELSSASQAQYSANKMLEQTADLLDYKIENIIYISDQIFFDNTLNQTLKRDENLPLGPALIEDYNNIRQIVIRAFKEDDMFKLTLYLHSNVYYSKEESNLLGNAKTVFSSIDSITSEKWYPELEAFRGKVMWIAASPVLQADHTKVYVISCVRFIKDISDYNNNIGLLRIDLLQSQLVQTIKKVTTTANGLALILNSDGTIIASSDSQLAASYPIGPGFLKKLDGNENGWSTMNTGKGTVVVGVQPIQNTDWELVSIIPNRDILETGAKVRNEMIVLIAVIGSLAYILAYFFSDSITKRIHRLAGLMQDMHGEKLPKPMEEKGSDEISILIRSYNYMISRMNEFSETQYKLGQEIKNMEMKALQAQINPHFLYNTLELINWTAIRRNVPEISDTVQALAKFYKLSLSKGRDIISVHDEISHIETYVKLQNMRFKNTIDLRLSISENINQYCILKLILQPIIENSILHGIMSKPSHAGVISVAGEEKAGNIVFSISDDGVGMNPESLSHFLDDAATPTQREEQGYGIKNVNHRIKLYYGDEYGLTYVSVPGKGTTVTVTVPAISAD